MLKRKDIMSIQALREQLSQKNREAQAMLAAAGDKVWSKDDQAKYDTLMDEGERLSAQIKAHQRQLDADAERNFEDASRQATKNGAGKGGELSLKDAVAIYLRHGSNVSQEQAVAIRNAMSTTTAAEGGYTVPTEVATMVIDALKAFGGMREAANVITTSGGNTINFPTSDGTAEEGEIVGQNSPASSGDPTFGVRAHDTYKFSSKKIALPWELVQDSAIDILAFVTNRLAQRLGRIQNRLFTVGTGSSQPYGLMAETTLGKTGTTGQTVTVIYDDLVDLVHSVNRAYRNGAKFMMADSSVKVVRKIKDSNGRPIFAPGYETGNPGGAPDTLIGYPLTINDDVAAMAANAKSIAFGQLNQYLIRDVMGLDIRRFDDSAFALNGQIGFCGWQRSGGRLLDTSAVKHYANSAT